MRLTTPPSRARVSYILTIWRDKNHFHHYFIRRSGNTGGRIVAQSTQSHTTECDVREHMYLSLAACIARYHDYNGVLVSEYPTILREGSRSFRTEVICPLNSNLVDVVHPFVRPKREKPAPAPLSLSDL